MTAHSAPIGAPGGAGAIPPLLPHAAHAPLALSDEQVRQLIRARRTGAKIRRATFVALFDGWMIAVFGALTFAFGLGSIPAMVLGFGMGVAAFVELRGAGRLRRLEPGAARRLGFNQLALMVLLVGYAASAMYAELSGGGIFATLESADAVPPLALAPFEDMGRRITMLVYGTIIAVSVLTQGGTAVYYFTRTRLIEAYRAQVPPWILQMHRANVGP